MGHVLDSAAVRDWQGAMGIILGIMLGGAAGALCRYGMQVWMQGVLTGTLLAGFPLATLIVNVSGSFLLSLLVTLGLQGMVSPAVQIAVGSGFLGALTTFSTFEFEGEALLREGRHLWAGLYLAGNVVLGYWMILLGRSAGLRLAAMN